MRSFYFLLLSNILTSCLTRQNVDLIVHNANIYTADENFSIQQAMAISGDSIVEVGPEHQILNKYSSEQVIDAQKQYIYPGFIDAHSHFMGYAKTLNQVDLLHCTSADDMHARISGFAKQSNDEWVIGRGWDQNLWENPVFPNKVWLDEHLNDRYVALKRVDGHAVLVNQKVLDLLNIDENTVVDGGKIEVIDGECTGILIDNAADLVTNSIPYPKPESLLNSLQKAQNNCFAKGLTSVCDAGLDLKDVEMIQEWHEQGNLDIKLYIMLNPSRENFEKYLEEGPIVTRDVSIRSFKFYLDGALGSRGALLKEDYSDDPGNRGLVLSEKEEMLSRGRQILAAGFQMNTHAIGDGANSMILRLYGDILEGTNDHRWRVEHAQVVSPEDLRYFRDYNIIPSVQPTHATSDMMWADERLGEDRIDHAYAYKSLIRQNGLIALGTDFPVEDIDPLKTLLSGYRRTNTKGEIEGGYYPEEGLSFEECIRGMTIWAAIANFEEDTKGSLEAGKKADFVIFNRDLKDLKSENFNQFKVVQTFLNGASVYQNAD